MNTKTKTNVLDLTITGIMAALVFVGTYYFKIPGLLGYTHLGDCMIVLAVCLFGTKKGAAAGAIGAGLADFLGGYTIWVLPTACIKAAFAITMGFVTYKLLSKYKYGFIVGAVVGGLVHILLYTLVKIPLFGIAYALSSVFSLTMQTLSGIVLGSIIYFAVKDRLKF